MFEPKILAKFKKLTGTDLESIDQAKRELKSLLKDQTTPCLEGIHEELKQVNAVRPNEWANWTAGVIKNELEARA